jgi:hypothetical protein
LFKAPFGRILLSLSIIAGVVLPVAPGVIEAARANDLPGLTPTFGSRIADSYAGGFKYQVSNYDATFTWTVSATVGTPSISSSGLVSVTGVGPKLSSTLTVNTSKDGHASGTASVTSVGPWNLSDEIQAQSITASLSGTTLTVNVPDAKGWRWSLIWSGAVQATNITSFPYTFNNFTSNREIQLGAVDSLENFGYSRVFLPTVTPSAPVNLPGLTPTFGARVPDYYAPGFKHQISNYDPAYTWTVTSSVGTATINSSGLVSVAGVGAKVSATVTVTTNRTGYNSANASVTSVGPWNLSDEIQAQNITASLSGTTLTVNVPDAKGWTWGLIWSGGVQVSSITSFPYVVNNFTPNKEIQLTARDNLENFGYSRMITPTTAQLIAQANFLGIFPADQSVGMRAALSSSGGSGTGAVTFTSSTPSICTVSGSTVTSITTGTCSIVATKAADATYSAATFTGSFPVYAVNQMTQANLSVSISNSLRVGSTATLSTTGGAGTGAVTFATSSSSICTVSGNTVTAIAVGTCSIMATKAMDFNYIEAVTIFNTPVVATQVSQSPISVIVPSFLAVGVLANLSTSGGSGTGAITFTSLTTSICTVSGTVVRAVAVGTCTINATKAADSSYLARSATASFTVSRTLITQNAIVIGGPISLAAGRSAIFTYSGGSGTGAISTSSNTPAICTVSGTTVTGVQAGTCQLVVTKGADSTYSTLSATRNFTITQPAQLAQAAVILSTYPPSNLGINLIGNFQFSGGSGSGAFSYSTTTPAICSVTGTQVRGLTSGTCVIVANKAGDANYLAANPVTYSFNVGKRAQSSFTFSPSSPLKIGTSITLAVSGGSGTGAVVYTTSTPGICSVSGSTLNGISAGSCIVSAVKTSDSEFLAISSSATVLIKGLLTQTPISLRTTLTNSAINVGGFYGVTVSGGSGSGQITYSTSTPSICAVSPTVNPSVIPFQIEGLQVGTCSVTVRKAADSEYSEATVSQSYPVVRALKTQAAILITQIQPLTIGENANIEASGGSGAGSFSYSSMTGSICSVSGSTVYANALGTCSISVRKAADSEFDLNTASISFQIRGSKPVASFSASMNTGQPAVGTFFVSGTGTVSPGSSLRISQVCLTIDGSPVTSGEVSNTSGYGWWSGFSNSTNCFNTNSASWANSSYWGSYRWRLDTSNFQPGIRTLTMTVTDSSGTVSNPVSTQINIKSLKPTIQILSPSMGSVVKGKVKVSFLATVAQEAGRSISYLGISEENAVASFSNGYSSWRSPFSSGYKAFSMGYGTSSGTFGFEINTQKYNKGLHTFRVAIQDSYGDIAEATVTADIQALKPSVQILSPSSGQTFEGVVTLKIQASPDPSAAGGEISYIGIDNKQLTPEFAGTEQNSGSAGFPSSYRTWEVNDLRNFTFTATPGSLKNGLIRLTVLVADDTKATASASVEFTVATANPTAVITSPLPGTITPGVITVTAETKPNPVSGGRIVALGISDKNAKPTFFGSLVNNSSNENISRNYSVWSVDDIQKPSWKVDITNWAPGDHIITVVTQDSNGKVGQGSVVVNIAPKGTFTSILAGPPVLGKSVPISVEMKTNAPYRSDPPVVVTLQSSPTEAGPWKDLGDITLDATGKGGGSVVVTAKLWVRAIHKQLDAVQPGVGAPLRIVNVPDPNRTTTTSGGQNPDGSVPKVTCVPKSNAKSGRTVSISCSQVDVQDPSQPMQLFVQRKNKFVPAGKARFEDGFIKASIASSAKGKLTFQVRGLAPEESEYVVWKSNMFTITWG